MSQTRCPTCQTVIETDAGVNFCPTCGVNLHGPPIEGWVIRGIDMRTVARRQRTVLWLVLGILLGEFIMPLAGISPILALIAVATYLGALVFTLVMLVQLMAALRFSLVSRIFGIIGLFIPCINLLLLLVINNRAVTELRMAGLRVGFMGVKDEDVVNLLSRFTCRGCGYSLVGNVSGRCPECNTPSHLAVPVPPPAAPG